MFLNITNFNGKSKEELKDALKNLGVEFKEYTDGLHQFFNEESAFRLDMYLEDLDTTKVPLTTRIKLDSDKAYKEITSAIANKFMTNEFVFNYDNMDDIVRDEVNNYLVNNYDEKQVK